MVAIATPKPRVYRLVDETGNTIGEIEQCPYTGGVQFGLASFGRPLIRVSQEPDGVAVVTFDAEGQPDTIIVVSSDGQTQVEKIDLRTGSDQQ